jgi:hypothetical protein
MPDNQNDDIRLSADAVIQIAAAHNAIMSGISSLNCAREVGTVPAKRVSGTA